MVIVPILWVLFGIAAAMAASRKDRSRVGWFILGILLGPFALIFALLSKDHNKPVPQAIPAVIPRTEKPGPKSSFIFQTQDELKQCPACAETIKLAAVKCRFCGEQFDHDQVAKDIAAREDELAEVAGRRRCPQCRRLDVIQAYLPDGGLGPWCPHCRIAV